MYLSSRSWQANSPQYNIFLCSTKATIPLRKFWALLEGSIRKAIITLFWESMWCRTWNCQRSHKSKQLLSILIHCKERFGWRKQSCQWAILVGHKEGKDGTFTSLLMLILLFTIFMFVCYGSFRGVMTPCLFVRALLECWISMAPKALLMSTLCNSIIHTNHLLIISYTWKLAIGKSI